MSSATPTALITGGGQGIGKAIAREFLLANYRVVIAEIDPEAGEETVREFADLGEIRCVQADVAREADVQHAVAHTLAACGRLDVLVNNAGISHNVPVTDLSLEDWRRVLDVNLTGAFLCTKYAAPALREAHGVIINIASTRALMSEANTEAYSASKGGLLALTHALAVSLGPQVRVHAISPGWIEVGDWQKSAKRTTPHHAEADRRQHPAGRVGAPEDIARLCRFLADPQNSFLTGENIVIDGGMTRKMIYEE